MLDVDDDALHVQIQLAETGFRDPYWGPATIAIVNVDHIRVVWHFWQNGPGATALHNFVLNLTREEEVQGDIK